MAFPRAANLQIHRSKLNIAGRDINNYHDDRWKQDTRGCVRSAMGDHLHTDAYHDSGMRRDPSRCYPGTREAALETISRWARDPESHCFWLHGPAGAGKSAIAQTFAEQCDQDNLTLGATYFFTKGSTGGPVHGTPPLFPTLAYQLVLKFPGLDEHLWGAIDADQTIFKRSLSVQLEKLIVQPFLKLGDTSPPAVVVIDGLDECDGDSIQGEIVRLIMGLERHSLPLLFLISSRPEFEIRRAFESFPSPSSARLPLDKTLHPDRDIRHFLVSEFERMYVEMGMPPVSQLPWPSTEDIEELVRKSSGHFIYAATVIRFVQEDHAHPMDRLDALLQIQSESISSSPTEGVIANSAAFQELDRLYLHILRKYRNRAELPKILRAIMYFGFHDWTAGSSDEIERVFGLTHRSIHFMLRDLHSIISVPVSGGHPLRFLHASFSDFLTDPERSQEFYFDINHFNAELACGYMRLIVAFKFSKPDSPGSYMLGLAIHDLGGCLKDTAALLSDTLGKLIDIVTQESESTPPCLLYTIIDFLLQDVLKELLGAEAEREYCKTILQQLEPQLIELSDNIITIVRVIGAYITINYRYSILSTEEVSQLIFVPNGEEIFRQTLNFGHYEFTYNRNNGGYNEPLYQIYKSLFRWFLAHHQPKKLCPTSVALHQYTWAWAWDTYASQYFPPRNPNYSECHEDFVHHVDLIYGCLRLVLLEFDQPMNLIPPLALRLLQCAARGLSLRSPIGTFLDHLLHFNVLELVEAIDFPSMLRALPNLTTIFCPGLFYLHHGLDKLYSLLDPIRSYGPIPRYQKFLETIYSQLLQDPLASRVVPVIYAMFFKPSRPTFSHEALALLLGLAPGVLYRSAAVQGLFGFGLHGEVLAHVIHRWSLEFKVPHSLAILLKTGRVKLQNFHIDDYIHGIHEDLAISCTKYLASYTGPEGLGGWDREPSWYAKRHWSLHLRRAKPSERLFETLRQVDISGHDIELVLEWLEENPNAPEDVLTRWRAAREDPGIISVLTTWEGNKRRLENMEIRCYLDEIFQKWMRHRDAAGMETGSDEDSEF